jgi:transposase
MAKSQATSDPANRFGLLTERLGPLPLINHFLARLGLDELLEQFVPTADARVAVSYGRALGVLLRSLLVEREPMYRQHETVYGFAPELFGLSTREIEALDDDRLGRALDHLFDADRSALITAVALAVGRRFEVRFAQLHNDSTSIAFCGQYRRATGRQIGARRAPAIVYGYSKDKRPDLKQLLFILTSAADGGVPVHFRCADGNTNDSVTHRDSWEVLRQVAGRADFLYVADSKLCSRENLAYIDQAGGRFVTVVPRSRMEDGEFRKWIQTHNPAWEMVWDKENRRRADGPRDRWYVCPAPMPASEGWPIYWVFSTILGLRQEFRRRKNITAAEQALTSLRDRLAAARARLRGAAQIDLEVAQILQQYSVGRYLKVRRVVREEHLFKQTQRGRPGPDTAYRKITRRRYSIEWTCDDEAIAYDHKSDGMYPVMTNDRALTAAQVLLAHKAQPTIEKRFEQVKTVHEIAPVFLKNEGRIEALFTLYFFALLVQALIERELRNAMQKEKIDQLPLYPEQRPCRRPTTEQVLRLFAHAQRHTLYADDLELRCFDPELSDLQQQVLTLLGVPLAAYRRRD